MESGNAVRNSSRESHVFNHLHNSRFSCIAITYNTNTVPCCEFVEKINGLRDKIINREVRIDGYGLL